MQKSAEPAPFVDRTEAAPQDGPLDRVLRSLHPGSSWNSVRRLIETGKVSVDGEVTRDPTRGVRRGSVLAISMRARRPTSGAILPKEAFVYIDSQVVVVRKPAGVSTVPYDETETDTLVDRVHKALKAMNRSNSAPPGIVHRLDKETSGLILFARTLAAKRALKQQFRVHSVHRRYVALSHGFVDAQSVSSRLVRDRGDGRRGSTDNPTLGRDAITHIGVLERLDGATVVECRLETGRTHQIRIHLAELGHPLLGETLYLKRFTGPILDAPRLMLHAREIGFSHPATGQPLHFEEPMPDDMRLVLESLRRR
ncbi:MAG TPA: RluA family pseudouridine synthase [Polyangiaceae bacterium]|nr:RluA family pseudouridine synthase [Polyangiaceae bacterium]